MAEQTPADFLQRGRSFMRRGGNHAPWPPSSAERRRFKSFFGVNPEIIALLWGILVDFSLVRDDDDIDGLLYAMMFLKIYAVEVVLCALAGGIDEKKFRDASWHYVEAIAELSYTLVRSSSSCLNHIYFTNDLLIYYISFFLIQ